MGTLLGLTGAIGSGKSTLAEFLANTTPDHAYYETWHIVAEIATAFNQALKAELAFETTNNPIDLTNQVLIWMPEAIAEHLHHDLVWNQLAITKQATLTQPELHEKLLAYLAMIGKNPTLLDTPINSDSKTSFRPLLQWLGGYLVAKVSKTIWYDELMRRIELRNSTASLVIIGGVRYVSDAEVVRAHGGHIVAIERPNIAEHRDVTEAERSLITPDIAITNNGTLDQLRLIAENLANDLAAGQPKKRYSAAAPYHRQ